MPSSDDRFYLLEMSNRPAQYGDVGSLLRIEGLVIGGAGAQAVLMLPAYRFNGAKPLELDIEEWSDFVRRSDNPEILVGPKPNGMEATLSKIFQRKVRYEISGAVQQKVWAADGFKCMYCGRKMGEVLMTIDHFIPLELGGKNNVTNFVSACKPCNKDKGSQDTEKWLDFNFKNFRVKFEDLKDYLSKRVIKV